MSDSEDAIPASAGQRLFYRLRREGDTPGRQAAAFALGTLIGCSPLFGFHLPLSLAAGWLFGLNRVKIYLAANISNPLMAPFLLFMEIQAGRWLRSETFYPLSFHAFRPFDAWRFGADLAVGSLVVGAALGAVAAGCTYALAGRGHRSRVEAALFQAAADRYLPSGILAWEFANGKLRRDPVYGDVLRLGLLPAEGRVADLGAGRGLMLTLIAVAVGRSAKGEWPGDWAPPPGRLTLTGVDVRGRMVRLANQALGRAGTVVEGDVCSWAPSPSASTAVLLFDVLHMLSPGEQDQVLDRAVAALEPGGVLILREADRDLGWRVRVVQVFNWMKGVFEGALRRRFHFRSANDWMTALEARGLTVRTFPPSRGSLLPNVLIEGRKG